MKYPPMYHVYNRYFNSISYKKNKPLKEEKMKMNQVQSILTNREIVCHYNGKDRHGVVKQVSWCQERGYLYTIKTEDGYRSMWAKKMSDDGIKVVGGPGFNSFNT